MYTGNKTRDSSIITSVVTTFSRTGAGLQIHITRSDGLTRTYPYTDKNGWSLNLLTVDWRASYFPRSIHATRDFS